MTVKMRDYQIEALDALAQAEAKGVRRCAIVLPTGSGKSIVFGELVRRTKGRVLLMAHRDELIEQAVKRLKEVDEHLLPGVVKAERDEIGARVVIASVQTLAQEHRRDRLFAGVPFERVIVDELHHIVARSYRDIITEAGCFETDGPLLLGVTATINRGDGVGLSDIIQQICYEKDILWGIRNDWLCDLKGKQVYLDVDLDAVRQSSGDFQDGALGEAMEEAGAPEVIAAAYLEHAAGRRTIVFTPTVRLADLTAAALRREGVAAELVHGAMEMGDRRATLQRFTSGETLVVANCAVLSEGYDNPAVDCIILARPTKSGAFYRQMVGRATRKYPGKEDALVLDLYGNTNRHKLVTLSDLFGLPLSALKDGKASVTAALDEQEAEAERKAVQRGAVKAREVDLFGERAKFNWVAIAGGWVLPGGKTAYHLTSNDKEHWRLVARQQGEAPRVLGEGTNVELFTGMAEDAVRASGSAILARKDARWRQDAPSDKQLLALARFKVKIPDNITRGGASDLLDAAMAGLRR